MAWGAGLGQGKRGACVDCKAWTFKQQLGPKGPRGGKGKVIFLCNRCRIRRQMRANYKEAAQ